MIREMVTSQTIPTRNLMLYLYSMLNCSFLYSTHCTPMPFLQCLQSLQPPSKYSVTFSLFSFLRVFDRFLTDRFLSPYLSTSSLFFCYANELSLHEEKERSPFFLFFFFILSFSLSFSLSSSLRSVYQVPSNRID
jgi:hypothetical protein